MPKEFEPGDELKDPLARLMAGVGCSTVIVTLIYCMYACSPLSR